MEAGQIPGDSSCDWIPPPELVRDALESVLKSQSLRQSTRVRDLLRFAVEAAVRGETSMLKESVLGVQVFERAPDYDPKLDPIVRVTVARLRTKLDGYYLSEGRFDRLRIEFPKGSYRPIFRPGPAPPEIAVERQSRAPGSFAFAGFDRPGVLIASMIAIVISAVAVTVYLARLPGKSDGLHAVPLTSFRGHEMNPALSPDGQSVAFAWNGEKQQNFDIYVMRVGSNAPVRLTSDAADDVSPAWSPDGGTLAFVRRLGGERGELTTIAANGGPEYKIRQIVNRRLNDDASTLLSLSWSPDGRWIAASDRRPQDASERIYLFSRTGESRPLISNPGLNGDHMPAFSPEGNALVFCRLQGWSASEIYEVPLNDSLTAGEPRRLSETGRWCVHPAWLGRGRVLYLLARQPGTRHELRIAGSGVTGENTLHLDTDASEFAAGRGRLVYTQVRQDTNIWRAKVPGAGDAPSLPAPFIASTWKDDRACFSPDGRKIAFTSLRSGYEEIWVVNADSSSPVRITNFGGPLVGYAAWSPDGQWLVFHARPDGQADLFMVPASGGPLRRLTSHPADDTVPTYSPDGHWIYFTSKRSGRTEIWRMRAEGGEPVQLTKSGGSGRAQVVNDKVFYFSLDATRLLSMPVAGGPSSDVAGPLHGYPSGFAATPSGVYYAAPPHSGELSFIRFSSFTKVEDRPVALVNRPFFIGMTVSPDEKYLLFDQFDEFDRDLMLVSNFHPQ